MQHDSNHSFEAYLIIVCMCVCVTESINNRQLGLLISELGYTGHKSSLGRSASHAVCIP